MLAFFQSWNPEGLFLLCSKLFLLSRLKFTLLLGPGGDQNMQGIECYAQKLFMIKKTPTPHDRTNHPVNDSNRDFVGYTFPFTIEATCG